MRITLLLIVFLFGVINAETLPKKKETSAPKKIASPATLKKQKFLFDILNHIYYPMENQEYFQNGTIAYVEDKDSYVEYEPVLELFHLNLHGMLPKGEIFSIFNEQQLKEAIALFNLFYYSLNWTVFSRNVLWARQNINEQMFIYSLTAAIIHRNDTQGLVLPALYEISPYSFFNTEAINDAQSWQMKATISKANKYYVWANYTSNYYLMNEESNLAYFTEDIGLNSYYYYYHMDYPFWMDGEKFGLNKDRHGELFLYMHQQLLARYYLERLANKMGEIDEFRWLSPIKDGYNPHLRYYNGLPVTGRKNDYEPYGSDDFYTLNRIDDFERRIRDTIDAGYYVTRDGQKIDFRQPESINIIGNIIQSNADSIDTRFFGYLTLLAHTMLGGANFDYNNDYKIVPSVMEHFETAMRDPVFYQFYKRLVKNFYRYKHFLQPYTTEELSLPGVSVDKITVGKLVTFFDYFDADITSILDPATIEKVGNISVPIPLLNKTTKMFTQKIVSVPDEKEFTLSARQMRLNHKPFGIAIEVTSDKIQKVNVRLFMGPKYDHYGNLYSITDNRDNFVELDQFTHDLPIGKDTILRTSKEFFWSIKDRVTFTDIRRKLQFASAGFIPFSMDSSEILCGFPDRLLLPKGSIEGLPMQLFVILTPHVESKVPQFSTYDNTLSCGVGSGSRYIDDLPFGFPFDRDINNAVFNTTNMYFKDILIYHKMTA